MDRYLCQLCNKIVTYNENHACFLYKNDDNVYLLLPEDESHEKDVKNNKSKCRFMANSNDNSEKFCTFFQKSDVENSDKVNSLPTEKNEQGSFRCHLKRNRTFSSLSDERSGESQYGNPPEALHFNIQANESRSKENSFFMSPSENFEPGYKSAGGFCVDYKMKPTASGGFFEQNKFEPKPSTSKHAAFSEECEMSLTERKLQSLADDKKMLMESLGAAQTALLYSRNILATTNTPVMPAIPSVNKETDNDGVEDVGDPTDTFISSPHVSSRMFGRNEGMAVNVKRPLDSLKALSAVVRPSGIHADCITDEQRQFICDICNRRFYLKNEFEKHYRTHTGDRTNSGEKPFPCDRCNKAFAEKSAFNVHYRTHTGKKPFKCDSCDKAFALKGNLDVHYRSHTGEKPFKCDICDKAFAHKSNLNVHFRTHTGEKPYVCERCKKGFSQQSGLKSHAKTHTRDES